MTETLALVVAAGRGMRLGAETPKQYLQLGGMALLRHSVTRLAALPGIDALRVVIHPDDAARYAAAVEGIALLPPVPGGASRQESARLGLESLAERAPARVLIHDAARPFPQTEAVGRVLRALDRWPAALPALPVSDTLKRDANGLVGETVSRTGLWRAQTPQGFRFPEILAAHRAAAGRELTDDAAVAEAAQLAVGLVEGDEEMFKVTTEADLARAEMHLAAGRETRSGSGFDVHRFAEGDHVMLCGLRIPHGRGLAGHSDADVGLHALTDAVLGSIAAGDIGTHFPPSDARWAGSESAVFLRHAGDLVAARGGRILQLDVTLICEAPKIGPHRAAMATRIAGILGIAEDRVSIKATTTEGLGFAGRREGIAAQALATVELPRGA